MSLGLTQPLTEVSTRNLPGCKGRLAYNADNLTAIYEPIAYKIWEPRHLTTVWASTAGYRDSFICTHETEWMWQQMLLYTLSDGATRIFVSRH
jgi:hypothetical protein